MEVRSAMQGPVLPSGLGMAVPRPGDSRGVEMVARGFEGVFLSMLLKEMRQTLAPDTLFGGDHGDVLGALFDQFLGEHLAQADALGIAAMVRKQLNATHTHDQHPPRAAGNLPSRPPLS